MPKPVPLPKSDAEDESRWAEEDASPSLGAPEVGLWCLEPVTSVRERLELATALLLALEANGWERLEMVGEGAADLYWRVSDKLIRLWPLSC